MDEQGAIWRRGEMVGGSHNGSPSYVRMLSEERRAETSVKTGYPVVMFSVDQQRMAVAAHRIVWMITNHSDIPATLEMNHKDGNKANHNPSNLELVTRAQNVIHAINVIGRKPKAQYGELNSSAKVTAEDVLKIRQLCKDKALPQSQIAKMFGITQSAVSCIHLRLSWSHVPESTG